MKTYWACVTIFLISLIKMTSCFKKESDLRILPSNYPPNQGTF